MSDNNFHKITVSFAILALAVIQASGATKDPDQAKHYAFFDAKIHPLLEANCFKCHGAGKRIKGGLRLTSREGLMHGGDSGAAFDSSDPAKSLILEMVSYRDDHHQMPPKGKLPQADIDALGEWVRMGAPYNPEREIKVAIESASDATIVNERNKNYWAFRTVSRPTTPTVKDPAWSRQALDGFIHAKLSRNGLQPNPPASPRQLIRRAFYDLIGLPPTLAEVEAFAANPSRSAFEATIDDLLSRPQYGEKWGRHWLDLVRYAESNGYERDGYKPHVWRYRDYVIKSFNDDKPYDRFIREQLAGDEIKPFSAEAYVATGYYRLGLWDDEPVDRQQAYYDGLDDIISVTGQAMLGLTIGCARCHDHKIDPIPQKDYYSMVAFLNNVRHYGQRGGSTVIDASIRALLPPDRADEQHDLVKAITNDKNKAERFLRKIDKRANEKLVAGEKDDYRYEQNRIPILRKYIGDWIRQKEFDQYGAEFKQLQELRGKLGKGTQLALVVTEQGTDAPVQNVLIRGNVHAKGPEVKPAFLSILSPPKPRIVDAAPYGKSTGRRTALANWITDKGNPLTARVLMNRLWQHHFGRGIVKSSDNFGRLGEQPTHPELLNWLAAEFMAGDWQIKRMHKLIMMSQAYRMSSSGSAEGLAKDPANNLFWRFNLRRLTAEEIRDSAVNLTGKLNLKMGGPSIYTEVPEEVLATASRPHAAWGNSAPEERNRRSVYVVVKRSLHEPILKTFDMADTDGPCSVRFSSILPTQSLTMLNSKFFNDISIGFARRVRAEAGNDLRSQIGHALALAFNRPATGMEISLGTKLMKQLKQAGAGRGDLPGSDPLERFCLTTLNLNEFVFVD